MHLQIYIERNTFLVDFTMLAPRHILALKSDTELFDEILKPFQTPTIVTSCDGMEFDDDTPIKDVVLLNLCE